MSCCSVSWSQTFVQYKMFFELPYEACINDVLQHVVKATGQHDWSAWSMFGSGMEITLRSIDEEIAEATDILNYLGNQPWPVHHKRIGNSQTEQLVSHHSESTRAGYIINALLTPVTDVLISCLEWRRLSTMFQCISSRVNANCTRLKSYVGFSSTD